MGQWLMAILAYACVSEMMHVYLPNEIKICPKIANAPQTNGIIGIWIPPIELLL